jgi:hypothetical protein
MTDYSLCKFSNDCGNFSKNKGEDKLVLVAELDKDVGEYFRKIRMSIPSPMSEKELIQNQTHEILHDKELICPKHRYIDYRAPNKCAHPSHLNTYQPKSKHQQASYQKCMGFEIPLGSLVCNHHYKSGPKTTSVAMETGDNLVLENEDSIGDVFEKSVAAVSTPEKDFAWAFAWSILFMPFSGFLHHVQSTIENLHQLVSGV